MLRTLLDAKADQQPDAHGVTPLCAAAAAKPWLLTVSPTGPTCPKQYQVRRSGNHVKAVRTLGSQVLDLFSQSIFLTFCLGFFTFSLPVLKRLLQKVGRNHVFLLPFGTKFRLLLAAHGDPHQRDLNGISPLHAAVEAGRLEIVRLLLEHDAPVDLCDTHGMTPLLLAATLGHPDISATLLAAGACWKQVAESEASAIHAAASRGFWEVVRVLIEARALP